MKANAAQTYSHDADCPNFGLSERASCVSDSYAANLTAPAGTWPIRLGVRPRYNAGIPPERRVVSNVERALRDCGDGEVAAAVTVALVVVADDGLDAAF